MRNRALKLMALLLSLLLLLTACGEYNPAVKDPGNDRETEMESGNGEAVTDEEGNVDENPFTVTLTLNGEIYIPSEEQPISVQWNDGYSIHTAPIGQDGVARVGGLDGDYRIRLTAIPEGYTYNPNIYTATNNDRHVEIELYKIVSTRGNGDQLYNAIEIKNTGLYCVELTSSTHEIFFEFAPPKSGTYSVESWMDTVDNQINPQAKYYGANAFFKQYQFTADGGGAENTYTKNFKLDVQIADEMISDNGQVTFSFGVLSTSTDGQYPIKVYFAITLDGEFSLNLVEAPIVIPQEKLVHQPEYGDEYVFVGAEVQRTENGNTANVFDNSMYKLWPKEDGGDDYYHLFSPDDYPETGGFGPILYAYVSAPCRFLEDSFDTLEYRGNKALTVNGNENYKLFIEGFDKLSTDPVPNDLPGLTEPYFCVSNCPCRTNATCPGACTEECTECLPDCRRCPEEAIGHGGYANYCNSDGVYGVTEELKDFLQKFSISQWLFFDGNGFVETNPSITVYAAEDAQWLFACGYYLKK